MKKTKTKCYLYTRVSTSMQVDGYSLDAQRDKLRKYAEYEDMVVAGEYSDEGFSGKNIQGRHEFQRMLQDIQDCKDGVEYVLVFKLSRFGRNAADVLNSLQLMQDFGVNLICVEDGIDSSKDSGKLMISVLSAVAEIERCLLYTSCHLRNKGISKPPSAAASHRIRTTTAAFRACCPSPRPPPSLSGSR